MNHQGNHIEDTQQSSYRIHEFHLPAGWQIAKLEDVVDILDNQRVPVNAKEREKRQGAIPYYGATGQVGWIDDYLFDEELVLLGEDGAPFLDSAKPKAYIIRGKSWVNNHAHVLRARDGIPNSYVRHYLNIVDYHEFVTGTTRLKLNQAAMRRIPIPVAPPAQQKRIVAEIEKQFSRLDEAVANLNRVKANLKRYKAAVLKAAVEGKLVETEAELARREGHSYETGEQLLQRILETRRSHWKGKGKYKELAVPDTACLPELPEGWVWATIGGLGDVIGGLTKNPKRATLTRKLPYLRVANVYENELRLDEIEEIGVEDSELEKLLVHKGDLLIVEGNGSPDQIGRLAIWDGSISPCVHQNHLIKVRLSAESMPEWPVSWLMSPAGRNHVRNVASSTSGLYTLSVGKVADLPVPVPPLVEQHRIVAEVDRRFSAVREVGSQVDANSLRSVRLRQSILTEAFSGLLLREGGISERIESVIGG